MLCRGTSSQWLGNRPEMEAWPTVGRIPSQPLQPVLPVLCCLKTVVSYVLSLFMAICAHELIRLLHSGWKGDLIAQSVSGILVRNRKFSS